MENPRPNSGRSASECYEQSAEEYAAAADRQENQAKHLERLWRFAARYAIAGHRFSSQQLRMG